MNKIFILLLIFAGAFCKIFAQQKTFLRIYDLSGAKFAKGYFMGTKDSSIFITDEKTIKEIPFTKIGIIKTKRSFGHSVFIGCAVGAIAGISLGVFSHGAKGGDKMDPVSKDIAGGFAFGTMAGGLCGAITSLFRRSQTFTINGSMESWMKQKILIDRIPIYKLFLHKKAI